MEEPGAGGQPENGESKPKPDEGASSAMLPKSLFAGQPLEPGSTVSVKIVAVHGDEIEVSPASEKQEEKEEGNGQSKDMADVMGKIDAMSK
jgi:hypothetical protein